MDLNRCFGDFMERNIEKKKLTLIKRNRVGIGASYNNNITNNK